MCDRYKLVTVLLNGVMQGSWRIFAISGSSHHMQGVHCMKLIMCGVMQNGGSRQRIRRSVQSRSFWTLQLVRLSCCSEIVSSLRR